MTCYASTRTASPSRRPASSPAAAPALALYEQVKDFIVRRIQDGSWRAGDRLPSESELVAQFGISRMTVNRALRELTEQGRIVRVAGVGSFVAEDKPQSTLLQIANLASEIRQRGHDYRCDVLAARRTAATLEVAAALDLGTGASVFHTQCVHRENGVPVQLEDRHVNPALAPDFLAQDFTSVPPSEYLLRSVPFDQVEHVVDAVLPTPEQAALLEMHGARALPAAHAPHLVARRARDRGALPAPGLALPAGQPLPHRRPPRRWLNMKQPPVALRAFPLLSPRCAMREGGRHQRGGAALARWPLAWAMPPHSLVD